MSKDELFRRSHDSPLTPEQRRDFAGLAYFDEDPAFRFEVTLDTNGAGGEDEVEMSDGTASTLPQAGYVQFRVGEREVRLLAYAQGHELFIPFRDATSGKETYGAGRYLEAETVASSITVSSAGTAGTAGCSAGAAISGTGSAGTAAIIGEAS